MAKDKETSTAVILG